MKRHAIGVLCLLVVAGIVVASLWPFNPYPKNEVSWANHGEGLQFGDYATVLSSGRFDPPEDARACAIEIWLVPGLTDDSNTIIAFSTRDNPVGFRIGQSGRTLYLARTVRVGLSSRDHTKWIAIHDVFLKDQPVFLSVTGDTRNTTVYLDGVRVASDVEFGLSARDLKGDLVVANSPIGNNSWSGLLKGLAVYYSALSDSSVARHYHLWLRDDTANLLRESADVLYLFRGSGDRIENVGFAKQPDLIIPKHYTVVRPSFLYPFWKSFSLDRAYLQDASNNVLAFIPLGLLLSAFLSGTRYGSHALRNAVLLGVFLSLTVEVLQYFLPMRDSDSTDVVMNTFGTYIGALLYNADDRYNCLGRLPFVGRWWTAIRAERVAERRRWYHSAGTIASTSSDGRLLRPDASTDSTA